MDARPTALIVAGPTCGGKSALALALARDLGGVVINADSMQIYRELRVLTARPSPDEEASVPHRLYGVRPAAQAGSVAWWRAEALAALDEARAAGALPILCGGTGLYLAAMVDGLSDIPDPGDAARAEARRILAEQGTAALHARLAATDPATAARLRPSDGQRVARAWEVLIGSGRGLVAWHAARLPPAPWQFAAIVLEPPREALREAIAARFAAMLEAGAIAEVASLLALGLTPSLPAMRAHGVPELSAHLRGEITLTAARARAEHATGQYTKRQATWFRHHALAQEARTHTIHARFAYHTQFSQREWALILHFVRGAVDAPA